ERDPELAPQRRLCPRRPAACVRAPASPELARIRVAGRRVLEYAQHPRTRRVPEPEELGGMDLRVRMASVHHPRTIVAERDALLVEVEAPPLSLVAAQRPMRRDLGLDAFATGGAALRRRVELAAALHDRVRKDLLHVRDDVTEGLGR